MSKIVNYAINIESGRPDDIAATFDLARHALAALAYGTRGYFSSGTLLTRPTLFASHVLHGPVRSEWPNLWFNTMGVIAEAVNGTVSVIRIDGSEDEVKFYSRELLSKMEKAEARKAKPYTWDGAINEGLEIRYLYLDEDCDEPLADFYPLWVQDASLSAGDIDAIVQGGCASGAYMPAVTYYDALKTMNEHGEAVLDYIYVTAGVVARPGGDEAWSWAGLAVFYLSTAVELWAGSVADAAEEAGELFCKEKP